MIDLKTLSLSVGDEITVWLKNDEIKIEKSVTEQEKSLQE
jgi:hypothetical protein